MLELPRNLVDAVRREGGADRRAWLDALPGVVARLARRWALRLGRPFQPGGQCSWVAPALGPAGRELVLKVEWRHPEAVHEADGLRLWGGRGAVTLHAAHTTGDTIALLLERCRPGTPLALVPEPAQDEVVCAQLRRLWRDPPDGHAFPALHEMCQRWADEFDEQAAALPVRLDRGIVRAGMELFRTLPATADRAVVLVTDLHAGNILAAQREEWLVIDPKPHVGDPAYDPLQHMLNCEQRLLADPAGFGRRLAELLDLDVSRLLLWLFARCVQESGSDPAMAAAAASLAP